MSPPPGSEDHIAEHIPWNQLTVGSPPDRSRLWYGIAAAVVAAVVGAVVVGAVVMPRFTSGSVASVPEADSTTTSTVLAPVAVAVAPLADPSTTDALSEADLMAIDVTAVERAVASRAEWVVLEFFSLDPGDSWIERVESAAGMDMGSGTLPSSPTPDTVSYVEWVRVTSLEAIRHGRYRVEVMMRRLVSLDGVAYERLSVEEVVVELLVNADGFPELVSVPIIAEAIPQPMVGSVIAVGRRLDQAGIGWPSEDETVEADDQASDD